MSFAVEIFVHKLFLKKSRISKSLHREGALYAGDDSQKQTGHHGYIRYN